MKAFLEGGVQLIRSPHKMGVRGLALIPMLKSLHHGLKGGGSRPHAPLPIRYCVTVGLDSTSLYEDLDVGVSYLEKHDLRGGGGGPI